MNEYIAALRAYVADNPPNYDGDNNSILEMIWVQSSGLKSF